MTAKPPGGPWFNPVAEFLGPAYLRNSFTKGTGRRRFRRSSARALVRVPIVAVLVLVPVAGACGSSEHGASRETTTSTSREAEEREQQAVLVHIGSLPTDTGLDSIEDPLMDAIDRADVGEYDGNEIGPDGAVIFLYGADADALWAAVEPVLAASPLGAGSYAILRYGGPGAREARVELG